MVFDTRLGFELVAQLLQRACLIQKLPVELHRKVSRAQSQQSDLGPCQNSALFKKRWQEFPLGWVQVDEARDQKLAESLQVAHRGCSLLTSLDVSTLVKVNFDGLPLGLAHVFLLANVALGLQQNSEEGLQGLGVLTRDTHRLEAKKEDCLEEVGFVEQIFNRFLELGGLISGNSEQGLSAVCRKKQIAIFGEFLNDFDQRCGTWRVLVLYLGFFLYLLGLRSLRFLGLLGDLGESSLSRNIGHVRV